MKKAQAKLVRHRKLVLRCEAVAQLTPPELRKVFGGDADFSGWPPRCTSDGCVPPDA